MTSIGLLLRPGVTLPTYASPGAAGVDVYAHVIEDLIIKPGCSSLVNTGLRVDIPAGYEIQVRPRSGLAIKNQITVLNSPGTIDSDYRGEIGIILINHGKDDFTVEPGMRIAQLVLSKVEKITWKIVDELSSTTRGEGGFGHTGL